MAPAKTWPRRLGAWAIQACIIGGVTLVLLEVALRIYDPVGIGYYPRTAALLDVLIREEPLGYRLPPNLEGTFYGKRTTTNSLGLRTPELGPKRPGEFRWLVLGDSVIFGVGVADGETIPRNIQQILSTRATPVTVINAGVVSYNTEQEYEQLKAIGMGLEPDLITLHFVENDIEPKTWVLDKRAKWYVATAERSYALSALFVTFREVKQAVTGRGSIEMGRFRPDDPRFVAIRTSLEKIRDLAAGAGVPFVVVCALDARSDAGRLFLATVEELGIAHVNLTDFGDRYVEAMSHPNSAMDSHPDRFGTPLWAELYVEAMDGLGVLPAR